MFRNLDDWLETGFVLDQALRDNVSAVKRPDRDVVLDYLTGRKTSVPNVVDRQRPTSASEVAASLPRPAPIQSSQHEQKVLSSIEGWKEKYMGGGRQKFSSAAPTHPGANVWTSGRTLPREQSNNGRQQQAHFINPWQSASGPSLWK